MGPLRRISEGCPVPQCSGALCRLNPFPLFLPHQVISKVTFRTPMVCIQLSWHYTNIRHELSVLLSTIILNEPGMEFLIEELNVCNARHKR
jgi:hypothetical protein